MTIVYLATLAMSSQILIAVRDELGLEPGVFVPLWKGLVLLGGAACSGFICGELRQSVS